MKLYTLYFRAFVFFKRRDGFGMNELLGIAAALILAAFIIIPNLQTFARSVMSGLQGWWSGTINHQVFSTAVSAT